MQDGKNLFHLLVVAYKPAEDYYFDEFHDDSAVAASFADLITERPEVKLALSGRDSEGCTPLHHAVRFGRSQCVRVLLEAGSDANASDNVRMPQADAHLALAFLFFSDAWAGRSLCWCRSAVLRRPKADLLRLLLLSA